VDRAFTARVDSARPSMRFLDALIVVAKLFAGDIAESGRWAVTGASGGRQECSAAAAVHALVERAQHTTLVGLDVVVPIGLDGVGAARGARDPRPRPGRVGIPRHREHRAIAARTVLADAVTPAQGVARRPDAQARALEADGRLLLRGRAAVDDARGSARPVGAAEPLRLGTLRLALRCA